MLERLRKYVKYQLGSKTPIHDMNGQLSGFAAPLWINNSPKSFLALAIWGYLVMLGLLFSYIFKISELPESCNVSFHPLIITEIAIVFINASVDLKYYTISYDSDQGWSRLLSYMAVLAVCLFLISGLGLFFALASSNNYAGFSCDNQDSFSNQIWLANFIVSINLLFLMYVKILIFMRLYYKYIAYPKMFLAIVKKPSNLDIED